MNFGRLHTVPADAQPFRQVALADVQRHRACWSGSMLYFPRDEEVDEVQVSVPSCHFRREHERTQIQEGMGFIRMVTTEVALDQHRNPVGPSWAVRP